MGLSLCIAGAGKSLVVAATAFTLSWTHSVERTEWRESWRLDASGLSVTEARVKGSGAGMEPGAGARLSGGWWVWSPTVPPLARLTLASSGATSSGWTLCHAGGCMTLGVEPGDSTTLSACP